jgi:hypothetical protein
VSLLNEAFTADLIVIEILLHANSAVKCLNVLFTAVLSDDMITGGPFWCMLAFGWVLQVHGHVVELLSSLIA